MRAPALEEEGLEAQVTFIEDDYRNIRGRYDAFVSIGMLEHVGKHRYAALGDVIGRCLAPNGRGLIQCIGRNAPVPMNGWAQRHIFPGAYPPSLRELTRGLRASWFLGPRRGEPAPALRQDAARLAQPL